MTVLHAFYTLNIPTETNIQHLTTKHIVNKKLYKSIYNTICKTKIYETLIKIIDAKCKADSTFIKLLKSTKNKQIEGEDIDLLLGGTKNYYGLALMMFRDYRVYSSPVNNDSLNELVKKFEDYIESVNGIKKNEINLNKSRYENRFSMVPAYDTENYEELDNSNYIPKITDDIMDAVDFL